MKKTYSLDYKIDRDIDRVAAVKEILNTLDKDPTPSDLEQMASYILYGKDETGLNAIQRGEITNGKTRYNSFRRKDDKLLSLDAILENPLANQSNMEPTTARNIYLKKKPAIARPHFNKNGEMTDPGDSDIPGMTQLWQRIDALDRWIGVLEGRIPPAEDDLLFDDPYRLYQLKHTLIDMRRHQYYLKDAYRPTYHSTQTDHPKAQFIDWTSDSFYWLTADELAPKTSNSLLPWVSKDPNDYEARENPYTSQTEFKWVVRHHIFNWEDANHVRAFLNNYDLLYNQLYDKLDTYGRALIFDFDMYRALANFSEVREFLIDERIKHYPSPQIIADLAATFGLKYNENHLSNIYTKEIPEKIAIAATKRRLIVDIPESRKKNCFTCGRALPRNPLFFSRNKSRKDGYASNCKECEKAKRIRKGG